MTRWQGMRRAMGFEPTAPPTARAAEGLRPRRRAMSA